MLLRAGTVLNDRYEVLSTVGTGGMADVYRARDLMLKRLVAIKVLKEEYSSDSGFVAKFRREAQAVGGLSHPNVVSVYDVGNQDDMYYIVMELVEGITLKKYIEKMGAMEEREAVEVAMQVAKGLEAAHEQGIIHRDVKPQNIIISRDGKIKVADFGIARMVSSETVTTSTMGSVHYIAPEQARGGACDARSDVYSLGITMFEMVTGRVPFDGDTPVAVAMKHVQEPLPSPRSLAPGLSENLEKMIVKCTQKNPQYRYGSMGALLVDFKKLLTMPGEDFVNMPAMLNSDPTVPLSKQDSAILQAAGIAVEEMNWADKGQAILAYEEGAAKAASRQKEDRLAEEKAKRTENILSYVMLGLAALILVMIIAIIFKACAIFANKTTEAPVPPTFTTVPYSVRTVPPTTSTEVVTESSSTEPPTSTEETLPSGTVELPDLKGKDYMEAIDLLLGMGLQVSLEMDYNAGPEAKDSSVTDQDYEPGTLLNLDTVVTIWVAISSDDTVFIPTSIVNKTQEEATALIRSAGMQVASGVEFRDSSVIPKGRVIDANPSVGTLVGRGTTVSLIISNGPSTFKLPDILGRPREEVEKILRAAGFDIAKYLRFESKTIKSTEYKPGTVGLAETFENGSRRSVKVGDIINGKAILYLTLTEEQILMPNVLGRTDVDAVVQELTDMGLIVSKTDAISQTYEIGAICWVTQLDGETDIPEGTALEENDAVLLHISVLAVPEGLNGKSVAEATAVLSGMGLLPQFAGGQSPIDANKAIVTMLSPTPGTKMQAGDTVMISFQEETLPPPTETQAPTDPAETPSETQESSQQATTVMLGEEYLGREDVDAVKAEIEAKGLRVEVKEIESQDYPVGQICWITDENDSEPGLAPDTQLMPGTIVRLYVSAPKSGE